MNLARRGSSRGGGCLLFLALVAILGALAVLYTRTHEPSPQDQPPAGEPGGPAGGAARRGGPGELVPPGAQPQAGRPAEPQGPTIEQQVIEARRTRDSERRMLQATREAAVTRISDSPEYLAAQKELDERNVQRQEARAAEDLEARARAATEWLAVRQRMVALEQTAFRSDPRVAEAEARLVAAERTLRDLERKAESSRTQAQPKQPPRPRR